MSTGKSFWKIILLKVIQYGAAYNELAKTGLPFILLTEFIDEGLRLWSLSRESTSQVQLLDSFENCIILSPKN
jgi:hypothetical protein